MSSKPNNEFIITLRNSQNGPRPPVSALLLLSSSIAKRVADASYLRQLVDMIHELAMRPCVLISETVFLYYEKL